MKIHISQKKKDLMSYEEIERYYDDFRQYYLSLPFDCKKVKIEEKYYRFFANMFNIFAIIKRTKILNKKNLNEKRLIFVSNHIGSYDQFYIHSFMKKYKYSPHYLVKEKVTKFLIRWNLIYKHVGVVVVNQDSIKSWQNAKEKLIKYLLYDRSIFIFPEGTRRGENNIGDFSTSVAQIAQETNTKILTMAIKNTKKIFNGNPIICLGEIIEVEIQEDIKEATERIKSAVLTAYSEILKYEKRG